VIAGVFVGGEASRMAGRPKGLLITSGGATIVDRWREVLRSVGVPMALVGAHPAYTHLGAPIIEDSPPGIGPLGGLLPLLRVAGQRRALALAGDMPFVSRALLERILDASDAPIVAPRRHGRWEPLCALYDAARVLPLAEARVQSRRFSLQGLLDDAGAIAIGLSAIECAELRDSYSPQDVEESERASEDQVGEPGSGS
jgi:molybdopterin-guanine dinucleotide biosynthesis protein A